MERRLDLCEIEKAPCFRAVGTSELLSRGNAPFDTDESKSLVLGPQQPVEYRQENVEVLLRSNMVRQMMRPPGIWHPSSVVNSQVDLYPHYDVDQERNGDPCQYPQVEQVVGNSKQ